MTRVLTGPEGDAARPACDGAGHTGRTREPPRHLLPMGLAQCLPDTRPDEQVPQTETEAPTGRQV